MSDGATVLWVGGGSVTGGQTGADTDEGHGAERLERAGYAVVRSTPDSVADALVAERFHCAVCDTGAPSRAEAVEAVETVEGSARALPVVVFASDGDESLAHRTVAAGADEYVPASSDRSLVDAVDRAVERGRASERDRGAERRLEALFADTPDPVIEYAFVEDEPVVESVNRAFVETFGYEPGVAVGEPLNDLVVPEVKRDEAASLDERVRAGERVHVEIERETTDGSREFLFRNIPVESGERPVGYAVYTDITDQKERERRLREQNDRLERFASVIGHDLRNPMGAVKHRIEMARQTGDDRHLDDAMSALDRMDELLRDLLQMARQGEELGKTEPVSLAGVARAAWDHIATGESSLVVTDDATVVADRGRLTQLLENLFINAVEHGATGDGQGTVEVRVGVDGGDCVVVEDDGRGIPVADRGDVFESGYSTATDGTGYGLAIVRQVARAHGWATAVTESDDGGARFEFRGVEFPD
ncbi:multi-sensor signal transduction histidine kinase [Halosimplex carlsbadense 2-9-1]|uniref:histidine kinase n=1 Tax=Halosimplex carlsbadense 2-9-1 TaxID=797114 RepID=M0CT95_9EURY|nr:ATP-binding protein [Halosimplex carlsbadense]ELZ25084.1 multi-sensor signal transduction histidine kinase [Halosimplex carlsbadense 2-9-1]